MPQATCTKVSHALHRLCNLCRPRETCAELGRTSLCHVFWALAVILLAFAGFTVIVVRLRRPAGAADATAGPEEGSRPERRIDLEQLKGFVYVGAGALALLALAVILMGLFANRSGRAEGLAVLGCSAMRAIWSRLPSCSTF
jgi:hypothetical protein